MVNETISLQINIVDDIGSTAYLEIHNATTSELGLVSLVIGEGTSSNSLQDIDWANGPYFMIVTVNGVNLGSSPLLSVPYALYAASGNEGPEGDTSDPGPIGPKGDQGELVSRVNRE